MSQVDSVSEWIVQLKKGDQTASQRLWQRYVEQLVRLARLKLGPTPRGGADEEDAVNSAFAAFFRGMESGRFPQMIDRDDLWQVLVVLTERKCVDQRRRELAFKRGGGAVHGDLAFGEPHAAESSQQGLEQIPDSSPTPEFAAEAAEEYQRLLSLLADDTLRRIALAKMEGYTNREISRALNLGLSSVERKLALIRSIWQQESEA
jgi:DNA-directed RNA polymerase specialized sigma24 family protein